MSGGILIVWTDVPAEIEADFNAWYNREHLPDRILRMPGFLRGRRYVATASTAGAPKYLAYYDLQSTAVMLSAAHTALRHQRSERDCFFVPQFRHTIKGICDVICRAGSGAGGYLVLLPVSAHAGGEMDFAQNLGHDVLPALVAQRGIASAVYARRNAQTTATSSAKDDRAGDRYIDGLIAFEATSEADAAAAAALLSAQTIQRAGGDQQLLAAPCVLRLIYALQKTDTA